MMVALLFRQRVYLNLEVPYRDVKTVRTLTNCTGTYVCEQGLCALPPFPDVRLTFVGRQDLLYTTT